MFRLKSLLLVLLFPLIEGNYRQFGFHNHDLCSEDVDFPPYKERSLQLGAGAAVLTLDSPGSGIVSDQYIKCSVKIEADQGFGLMVYIEDMLLRSSKDFQGSNTEKNSCLDYVQFGRDDKIPFITLYKSDKLCGNQTGFRYDEPGGKLLVWLNLRSVRSPSSREQDRLNVIITAYKHGKGDESTNFRPCRSGDRSVRKEYFCDWRVNCAMDADPPGDERPEICRHTRGADGTGLVDQADELPPLNLVSITLVLVSIVVVLFLLFLLVAWVRKSGRGCRSRATQPDSELPELRVENSRHETSYQPLVLYQETLGNQSHSPLVHQGRTTPCEEPPPAYNDLFPAGYKFEPKIEDGQQQLSSFSAAVKSQSTGRVRENSASEQETELVTNTRNDSHTN